MESFLNNISADAKKLQLPKQQNQEKRIGVAYIDARIRHRRESITSRGSRVDCIEYGRHGIDWISLENL